MAMPMPSPLAKDSVLKVFCIGTCVRIHTLDTFPLLLLTAGPPPVGRPQRGWGPLWGAPCCVGAAAQVPQAVVPVLRKFWRGITGEADGHMVLGVLPVKPNCEGLDGAKMEGCCWEAAYPRMNRHPKSWQMLT